MDNTTTPVTKYKTGRTGIIVILGLLMTISPFAIDMYLPAFSKIADDFHTTSATVSLSITSYFIGFAFGQLLYGPLLDRFGRKKPLYAGLAIFIICSAGCMVSNSVGMLVGLRFIQALGGCVAGVAAMTMARDFFPVEESAKIFSLLVLILGLSPLLAPTLGGFITAGLGWKWVFIGLMLLAAVVLAIVVMFLPTGYQPDKTISLRAKPMVKSFLTILRNKQFYTYTLSASFSFASLLVYVAGSSLIFMEIYHVSPQVFGGIFALLSVGFIGGNQVNILLLKRYKSENLYRVALISQLIIAIIFLVGAIYGWWGLVSTIVMFFLLLSTIGLIYPNGSALALAPFTSNVGTASALLGFLQIGIGGLASSCIGLFNSTDSVPILAMEVAVAGIANIILQFAPGRKLLKLNNS
jgi:DHA1 family bicyclomycin/chloramphenicol resistance-like MFS transporter